MAHRQLIAQHADRLGDEHIDGIGIDDPALVEGAGREQVPARSPTQPQVDAPREESRQGGETFGDLQRAVVHRHNAARAHADAPGGVQNMHHEQIRSAGDEGAGVVMLSQPETVISDLLHAAGQPDDVLDGLTGRAPREERNLFEDTEPQRRHDDSLDDDESASRRPAQAIAGRRRRMQHARVLGHSSSTPPIDPGDTEGRVARGIACTNIYD